MTKPVTKVEFGFTQASPGVYTFQDITEYVRSVEVSRGLSRDLDEYSAATCNVTLDNRARTFDPSYTSSPFYGQVKPQASVRISTSGVIIFTGYVDSWSFDYSIVGDQTATFNALDGTTRIANTTVTPQTFTRQYAGARIASVTSSTAVAWLGGTALDAGQFLLDTDTVGEDVSAWDYIQQVATSDGGAAFINGEGQLVFKSGATSDFPSTRTTFRYNLCKVPGFESATITGWTGTRSSTVAYKGSWSLAKTTTTSWDFLSPSSGYTIYGVKFADATTSWVQNYPYVFSAYVYSATAQTVIVTGGFKKTTAPTGLDATQEAFNIPAATWTRVSVSAIPSISGMTANFSVDGASAIALYVDGVMIEQSASLNDFFDGTYGPTDTATVAYTEAWNGTANISASTLTIVTTYPPNTTPLVPLSDAGGTAIPYTNISVVYGSELNYNKTIVLRSVTSTGGTASNATNGSAYGIRVYSSDQSLIGSDADAQALANFYLGAYEDPELRVELATIDLHALSGANQDSILNQDIWDGAQVTFTPGGVGSAIVSNQKIIGIKHTIGVDQHRVEWNFATWGNKFRLDSTILGVLDQNVLGY